MTDYSEQSDRYDEEHRVRTRAIRKLENAGNNPKTVEEGYLAYNRAKAHLRSVSFHKKQLEDNKYYHELWSYYNK